MYWTGLDADAIWRANTDGSNAEAILVELDEPFGLALDLAARKMYWMAPGWPGGKIQRADLDGSNVEDVLTGLYILGSRGPGLALDTEEGRMYWGGLGSTGAGMFRAEMDGSAVEHFIGDELPAGLAVDPRIAGDCDDNRTVDLADFGSFVECISGPGETSLPECQCADLDYNRSVDLADFGALQRAFGDR